MGLVANVDNPGTPPAGLVLSADVGPEVTDVPPPPVEPAPVAGPQDRIELFSINGQAYYVPKRPGPNVALGYLRDIRRYGSQVAVAGLLEAMLGRDGLDALADYEDLTDAELGSVVRAVEQHVLGPLKEGGGAGKH